MFAIKRRAEDLNKNRLEISVNHWPVRYAPNSVEHVVYSENVFHNARESAGRTNAQPMNGFSGKRIT